MNMTKNHLLLLYTIFIVEIKTGKMPIDIGPTVEYQVAEYASTFSSFQSNSKAALLCHSQRTRMAVTFRDSLLCFFI